jgi:hypothetical protein
MAVMAHLLTLAALAALAALTWSARLVSWHTHVVEAKIQCEEYDLLIWKEADQA